MRNSQKYNPASSDTHEGTSCTMPSAKHKTQGSPLDSYWKLRLDFPPSGIDIESRTKNIRRPKPLQLPRVHVRTIVARALIPVPPRLCLEAKFICPATIPRWSTDETSRMASSSLDCSSGKNRDLRPLKISCDTRLTSEYVSRVTRANFKIRISGLFWRFITDGRAPRTIKEVL